MDDGRCFFGAGWAVVGAVWFCLSVDLIGLIRLVRLGLSCLLCLTACLLYVAATGWHILYVDVYFFNVMLL